MTLAATRTRIAAAVALALTVGAIAAPTGSAVPVDPWARGLVASPDVHKVPARSAKTKKAPRLVASPDTHKLPANHASTQTLPRLSGR